MEIAQALALLDAIVRWKAAASNLALFLFQMLANSSQVYLYVRLILRLTDRHKFGT